MRLTALTTKYIREWLKQNGFEVGCRLGKDFAYDCEDNFIQVQRIYDTYYDEDFIHCLRQLHLQHNFDCVTLSILHELGHYETVSYFTDEEWECDNIYKQFLSTSVKTQTELNMRYWATDTEKSANEWAVYYVNHFPNKVQDLEDIIETTMMY